MARCRGANCRGGAVVDGNYKSTFDIRFPPADTIVFLDYPHWLTLSRAFYRRWKYRKTRRPDMAPEWRERLSPDFLLSLWTYRRRERPQVLQLLHQCRADKTVYVFDKPDQASHFWKIFRDRIDLKPRRSPGNPRMISKQREAALGAQLRAHPGATLEEYVNSRSEEQGQRVSRATKAHSIIRQGWTRKKSVRVQEQDEAVWAHWHPEAPSFRPAGNLVLLGECGVNTTLSRRYPRSPRGERTSGRTNQRSNEPEVNELELKADRLSELDDYLSHPQSIKDMRSLFRELAIVDSKCTERVSSKPLASVPPAE